jgi:NAD(P)H-dependent FMN reductase
MTQIVVIPGSWRKGSFNGFLARAALEVAPKDCTATLGSIRDFPLYDGDVEAASGIPAPVTQLKDIVAAADGVLLVTPEYNNGMPGTFKNAIDWMSRPPKDSARVYKGRAFGIIGATPGKGGTRFSQAGWLPTMRTLGTVLYAGNLLYVSDAGTTFGEDGTLKDPKTRELLTKYMAGLAAFAKYNAARPAGT